MKTILIKYLIKSGFSLKAFINSSIMIYPGTTLVKFFFEKSFPYGAIP